MKKRKNKIAEDAFRWMVLSFPMGTVMFNKESEIKFHASTDLEYEAVLQRDVFQVCAVIL
jgi:hypothetical protein